MQWLPTELRAPIDQGARALILFVLLRFALPYLARKWHKTPATADAWAALTTTTASAASAAFHAFVFDGGDSRMALDMLKKSALRSAQQAATEWIAHLSQRGISAASIDEAMQNTVTETLGSLHAQSPATLQSALENVVMTLAAHLPKLPGLPAPVAIEVPVPSPIKPVASPAPSLPVSP